MDSFLWTQMRMPLTYHYGKRIPWSAGSILVSLPLTWETLCLIDAIREQLGRVIVIPLTSGPDSSLQPGVFQYLRGWGVHYFEEATADNRRTALGLKPDIIFDCLFTVSDQGIAEGLLQPDVFIIEDTRTGGIRLREHYIQGHLPNPFFILDETPLKRTYENAFGIGYSILASLMSIGILLPYKLTTIIGYGPVGEGIAEFARRIGCRVLVCEIDPSRAERARTQGFIVASIEDALARADIVITATGQQAVISAEQLDSLRSGALLVNAGADRGEWDQRHLQLNARATPLSPFLRRFDLVNGKSVIEVAGGNSVNLVCGVSMSEVIDITFSVAAITLASYITGGVTRGELIISNVLMRELEGRAKDRLFGEIEEEQVSAVARPPEDSC